MTQEREAQQAHVFARMKQQWRDAIMELTSRNIPEEDTEQKTVIVVGTARGGTSAVASVLDALGVYMGPAHELARSGAFENQIFMQDPPGWKAEVDRCNNLYDIWGWKNPSMFNMLHMIPDNVRNPYLLFVFRDTAATAGSFALWHGAGVNPPISELMETANTSGQQLYAAAMGSVLPSLFVSYERIKTNPAGFVNAITAFCIRGNRTTPAQQAEAVRRISPTGGYLGIPRGWKGAGEIMLDNRIKNGTTMTDIGAWT